MACMRDGSANAKNNSVNMYASTWICTKTAEVKRDTHDRSMSLLSLGDNKRNSVEHLEL